MKLLRPFALTCASLAMTCGAMAATPVFHHTFATVNDESGQYAGTLADGASLETIEGLPVLNLGDKGYFDFGASLGDLISTLSGDYSFVTSLYIPVETNISNNGNFILTFANSSSEGYAFFGAKESRYSITKTNWNGEQTCSAAQAFPKGEWVNVAIVQEGNQAKVYLNGQQKKSAEITLHPSELGKTAKNWLGKSPYDGDALLANAKYLDFSIYNAALTAEEVAALAAGENLAKLNALCAEALIDEAIAGCQFDFSEVRGNLQLPTSFSNDVTGVWTSSNPELIANDGKVTRPAEGKEDAELTLTLTLSKFGQSKDFSYPAKVIAYKSDENAAKYDLDQIVLQGNKDNLRNSIFLPGLTKEGSVITWKSNKEDYLTSSGKVLQLSPADGEKVEVILTATAEKNGKTATRDFIVHIALPEDYDSYLFAFFPNNNDENLYYALSTDGFNYKVLNNDQMVLSAEEVALKKGIRDPFILRGEDGKFYMVATDMKCAEGWSSNRGMVLFKSDDLVTWTSSTVHFPDRFPEWANVTRVWAPEVIWDQYYENADGTKGRYLVYYSLLTNDGKCTYDKVYYSYANDDFTDLMTDPEFFYDRGSATIDCDIIYNEVDNLYHMVYKNEGSGGICQVTASRLTPEPGQPAGSQWENPSSQLQQTTEAVEGAGMFRLINTDTWVLMYDCYNNGHYQFCTTEDFENFRLRAQTETSGAFTPRHGSVLPLHPEETALLIEKFPATLTDATVTGSRNPAVRQDRWSMTSRKVYLPVVPGTDITSFDPMLSLTLGATVTPEGPQDFSNGAVTYSVKNGSKTRSHTVTVAVEANPVLPGFCADPEVLYSHKTGKFYIYPTTDGVAGWGGHTFNVYSSDDLVNWHKENCILDLATDDVTWATGNAWAPSIEEKLCDDGQYRYYFYFSGHNPEKNYKTLGCAVAESPVGPFRDLGKPMIDTNIASGQLIDSDVFTDPVTGDSYFYWGNGSLVASKLNADMTSVTDAKVITPEGGSLSDYAFREGVYVFYRDGKYYFLWSVDDTGAKNYHVAYGTADSPMGPITVAEKPIVIIQDSANEIYGTGHNSIVQVPGRDEWYIVYHRINKAFTGNGPGYHREVCIDKLEFNEDGTIKQVTPTHKGIDPVDLSAESQVKELTSEVVEGAATGTFFFDASGLSLGSEAPSAPGVYVKVNVYANGKTRASKLVIK